MASETSLLSLAESIADGVPVDWNLVESQATPAERDVVRQFRVVATLSQLHRSLPEAPVRMPHRMPSLSVPTLGEWGHLSVLERLGGGAFADVFRAWDRELEREVALKLLRAEPDDADPTTSRITAEGRLLARVRHPNVVTVYGVAKHQKRVGLWMEMVHGETLESHVRTHGPLGASEAAAIGMELCRALAALHAAGLVHRDVKAQNVMREKGGRIVLMDFGTGREVESTTAPGVAGTPLYLAPELLAGAPASQGTDLYSLGVLLYRLVTGLFPVRAATMEELHARHSEGQLVPLRDARPDLPSAFVRVIDRAIAADPARRYASAGAVEADLARALHDDGLVDRPQPETRRRATGWRAGLMAAAAIAVVAGTAWLWPSPTPPAAGAPAGAVRSIAVLPLANVSGNAAQDYFAEGMTDELIGTLGGLNGVNVISRTSAASFKGSKKPLRDIARALNVDAVLEGSVFVQPGPGGEADIAGRKVRIKARLIYAGTDTQIWDQTFDAVLGDVLTLQSRIAEAVARGISLRLSEQQQSALAADAAGRGGTQDPAAFDLYLHGRYYWNMRTEEGLKRSIQYFQEAIDRDPKSARAYAGLADAYSLLHVYQMMPRAEAEAAALKAATQALALDDSVAEAHASIGYIRMRRFEWSAAETEFRRALALKPSNASAHRWYGSFLSKQGRLPEALAEVTTAVEQDPLSAGAITLRGLILMHQRKYGEALAEVQKALSMDKGYPRTRMQLAEIYALQGQYGRALAEAERAAPQDPRDLELQADLGYIRAVAGRRADALKVRDDLVRRANANESTAAGGVAIIYVGLGDADRAFEWLARARDLRDPWIEYLKVDPRFDRLRADRRFPPLLASVGLPQ
ncbi:MAG: hypothetical protein A3H96_24895 [Acidobacteria bacterium RIFCSPLOWO2_02_FULL_67_36]|nr:MAG: hypothetical protein A3H96_24895 [Acidobacteria bacterium RIFCSPLOWO2_02_FULL_67_36]OFW20731.1 MAG: hypothetical protein A3G21_22520 [Acidobacteria bacterium RIFCSPLOWO2_12_FULL_66_21]